MCAMSLLKDNFFCNLNISFDLEGVVTVVQRPAKTRWHPVFPTRYTKVYIHDHNPSRSSWGGLNDRIQDRILPKNAIIVFIVLQSH